ncbi:ATP synthase subunit A, partial [Helicobacter pylori]
FFILYSLFFILYSLFFILYSLFFRWCCFLFLLFLSCFSLGCCGVCV